MSRARVVATGAPRRATVAAADGPSLANKESQGSPRPSPPIAAAAAGAQPQGHVPMSARGTESCLVECTDPGCKRLPQREKRRLLRRGRAERASIWAFAEAWLRFSGVEGGMTPDLDALSLASAADATQGRPNVDIIEERGPKGLPDGHRLVPWFLTPRSPENNHRAKGAEGSRLGRLVRPGAPATRARGCSARPTKRRQPRARSRPARVRAGRPRRVEQGGRGTLSEKPRRAARRKRAPGRNEPTVSVERTHPLVRRDVPRGRPRPGRGRPRP